jgi:thiamine biosynthesis lipoprotein ApbE
MNTVTLAATGPNPAMQITAAGKCSPAVLQRETAKALDLARFVHRLMSDPDSDLARLNRCAHIAPLRVHAWTWQALSQAVTLSAETAGAFDITVTPKTVRSGPEARHQGCTMLTEAGLWDDIELLADSMVRFRRPLRLSLQEIAPAFAVDKALNHLSTRHEILRGSVQCGPELRTCGDPALTPLPPPEAAWPATMLRPAVTTVPAWLARGPGGVRRASAITHPRSGKTLRSNQSVSVFSRTCTETAALTRAVLQSPQSLWNRLLKAHDSIALILTRRGEQLLFPV